MHCFIIFNLFCIFLFFHCIQTALSGLIESTKFMMQNEKAQTFSKSIRPTTVIASSVSHSNLPFNLSDVTEKLLNKKVNSLTPRSKFTPPSNRSSEVVEWPVTSSNDIRYQRSSSPIPDDDSLGSKNDKSLKNARPGFNIGWFNKTNSKMDSPPYDLSIAENGSYPNLLAISESQPDKLVRRGSFSRQTIKSM